METDQILQEQIKSAPVEIREILKQKSWLTVTEEVSRKNGFLDNQKDSLENEVLFVLLGMELIEKLPENLRINVGLAENKADEIYKEIYEKILKNIEVLLPTDVEVEQESKEEAKQRLSERMGTAEPKIEAAPAPMAEVIPKVPEIVPSNLPVVELGEVAHDVAPATSEVGSREKEVRENPTAQPAEPLKQASSIPHYPSGRDPYREPLN